MTFQILGISMIVTLYDFRAGYLAAAMITMFILFTDAIFSVIVTYIFLKPVLEVLRASGNLVHTVASRRLERTKRWNFAGVLVTVGSSTVLYINTIAYFLLIFVRRWSLHGSTFGNPYTFGLPVDSILNTTGVILLCGMFKDTTFFRSRLSKTSGRKFTVTVHPQAAFDSQAYEQDDTAQVPPLPFGALGGRVVAQTHL
jgi:hypothetical protein